MGNMLDYIAWRGDLSFERDPINEIDCLILAELSYIQWELIWQQNETTPLSQLYPRIADKPYAVTFTAGNDRLMLPQAAASARFGALPLSNLSCFLDEAAAEQFGAVTFHLPDGSLFISFRGTDCTIVGWHEDFKMACQPEVAAQRHAAQYLKRIAEQYPGQIRIAGHSKGGNLAVYAAATAPPQIQARLLDVLNFDGPGQNRPLFTSPGYAAIKKLRSIVPVSSIIGMLMCHPSDMTVVTSTASSIYQHDPYSWQLTGTHFDCAGDRNSDSHYFERVFRIWLSEISYEERAAFVDTIFDILSASRARTFGEHFIQNLALHPKEILDSLQTVDRETWQKVSRVVSALAGAAFEASPIVRLAQAIERT